MENDSISKPENIITTEQMQTLIEKWVKNDQLWINSVTGEKASESQIIRDDFLHLSECFNLAKSKTEMLTLREETSSGLYLECLIVTCPVCGQTELYFRLELDAWGGLAH